MSKKEIVLLAMQVFLIGFIAGAIVMALVVAAEH